MELLRHDLSWATQRMPKTLKRVMSFPEFQGKVFVGGGYLRSIVSGEPVNDVDVFVSSKEDAENLANILSIEDSKDISSPKKVSKTDNAYSVRLVGGFTQIIHRWVFDKVESVADSFDFTVCCAAISFENGRWSSYCDDRFYPDLAAKRLIYRSPVRNEDAGGSMLRVLKYYQKGYRIPLDSLSSVIGRLCTGVDFNNKKIIDDGKNLNEYEFSKIICGLLREVDPEVDPHHRSHLPSEKEEIEMKEQ